ncbi:MAG TPA: T9SS type A sorting domain-containing protein [Taishania sp.]|nr:T9SS type A sorting domain-containing protein [Taishania sp.]
MKQLLFILSIIIQYVCYGQSTLYKQYSNNGYDFGQGIVELPDSSYVITGASSSFMDAPSQMFLLKVDSLGNFIWSRDFGTYSGIDWGRRVKYSPTNGFYVGGFTNSFGNGNYDFCLWNIDENGNQNWVKTYGTEGWEKVNDMVLANNGDIYLIGETNNTTDGLTDILIVKVDQNGNQIWEQQLTNDGDDNANSVMQYDDTTFIIAGYYFNNTTNLKQAYVIRLHEDGSIVWSNTWGANAHFQINDIEIYDNSIIGVGAKTDENEIDYLFVFKLNGENGEVVASSTVESNPKVVGVGITKHFSPSFFDICTSYSNEDFSYGYEDLFFYGYTSHPYYYGNLGSINYNTPQTLGEMITSYNYSTVAVGYNQNIGPGGSSIFLYRTVGIDNPYYVYDDFTSENLVNINLVLNQKSISVYPNPANSVVTIEFDNESNHNYQIRIIDQFGKIVYTNEVNVSITQIDISGIAGGIYNLILEDENKNQSFKRIQIIK